MTHYLAQGPDLVGKTHEKDILGWRTQARDQDASISILDVIGLFEILAAALAVSIIVRGNFIFFLL